MVFRKKLLFNHIIEIIFPERCMGCGKRSHIEKYCFCTDCVVHITPAAQPNKYVISLARYEGPVRNAIYSFKYERKKWLGRIFARWMNDFLSAHPEISFDIIIPVPLHFVREFRRSFNQSWLVAYHLGKFTKKQAAANLLIKTKNNPSQTNLNSTQRKQNVKGLYKVKKPALIKDLNVLVIDDVYTTGATAEEVYRTLKNSGATQVYILTIARA